MWIQNGPPFDQRERDSSATGFIEREGFSEEERSPWLREENAKETQRETTGNELRERDRKLERSNTLGEIVSGRMSRYLCSSGTKLEAARPVVSLGYVLIPGDPLRETFAE